MFTVGDPVFFVLVGLFDILGVGMGSYAAYRLLHWASEREQQMEALALRAVGYATSKTQRNVPVRTTPKPPLDLDTRDPAPEAATEHSTTPTRVRP